MRVWLVSLILVTAFVSIVHGTLPETYFDCKNQLLGTGEDSQIVTGRTIYADIYIIDPAAESWSLIELAQFIYEFNTANRQEYSASSLAADIPVRDALAMPPSYQIAFRNQSYYRLTDGKIRINHGTAFNNALAIEIPKGSQICIPDRYYMAGVILQMELNLKNGTTCEGTLRYLDTSDPDKYYIGQEYRHIVRCRPDAAGFDLIRPIWMKNNEIGCGAAFGILRLNESDDRYDILCRQPKVPCYRGFVAEADVQMKCEKGLGSINPLLENNAPADRLPLQTEQKQVTDQKKDRQPRSGLLEWAGEQTENAGQMLRGVYRWARKLVQPNYCDINSDCASQLCKTEVHTCCADKHCCENGQNWSDSLQMCAHEVGIPTDTPCRAGWPNRQGNVVVLNEENNACDIFEVTDTGILEIARTTIACFRTDCKGENGISCHSHCSAAMEESHASQKKNATTFKSFAARYIIYALGPEKMHMQDYYQPEIDCLDAIAHNLTMPSCNPSGTFEPVTGQMNCRGPVGHPLGWASDDNMSENSCLMSDLPAHADLTILHTGTCVDYSVALTTLLRTVGYSSGEVYSLRAPGHRYNIIKFPESTAWNIVDTVGNYERPIGDNWEWENDGITYQHCNYTQNRCVNDAGNVMCPKKSEVEGCH
ncbi:Uncharacterised protein [uncultured archaeon]|nr:Uncharacterised protein [uncultured archaeon]